MRAVQKMTFKLLFKYWIVGLTLLTCAPNSQAQTEEIPLDLIELLGELDDEDNVLDAALTEIEVKKSKEKIQPNEVKK